MPSKKSQDKSPPAIQETSILLPGRCEWGNNYLCLADDVTDDEIRGALSGMVRIEKSYKWWLGDLICEIARVRPERNSEGKLLPSANPLRNPIVIAAMKRFGPGERTAYDCWRVCYFIKPHQRIEASTFQHHIIALRETGDDVDRALSWVRRAAEEGLSVSVMRAGIRNSLSPNLATNYNYDRALRAKYRVFYIGAATAKHFDISKLSAQDRKTLKADMQPLFDLLQKL